MKKFRPLSPTLSSARTTFGRRQLRSSAALHSYLMKKIAELGALSYSLGAQPLDGHPATVFNCTTSPERQLNNLTKFATLWCAATQSPQDLENGLRMFSKECSGPH